MSVNEVGTQVYELTRAQRGVVMSRLVLGHGGQWTISQLIRLDGDVDEALLHRALIAVALTAEPMFVRIDEVAMTQEPCPPQIPRIDMIDVSGGPDPDAAAVRVAAERLRRPFDWPLFRVATIRSGPRRLYLLLEGDHSIVDGYTAARIGTAVARTYAELLAGRGTVGPAAARHRPARRRGALPRLGRARPRRRLLARAARGRPGLAGGARDRRGRSGRRAARRRAARPDRLPRAGRAVRPRGRARRAGPGGGGAQVHRCRGAHGPARRAPDRREPGVRRTRGARPAGRAGRRHRRHGVDHRPTRRRPRAAPERPRLPGRHERRDPGLLPAPAQPADGPVRRGHGRRPRELPALPVRGLPGRHRHDAARQHRAGAAPGLHRLQVGRAADGARPRPVAPSVPGPGSAPDGGWPRIGDAELDLYVGYLAGVGFLPAAGR